MEPNQTKLKPKPNQTKQKKQIKQACQDPAIRHIQRIFLFLFFFLSLSYPPPLSELEDTFLNLVFKKLMKAKKDAKNPPSKYTNTKDLEGLFPLFLFPLSLSPLFFSSPIFSFPLSHYCFLLLSVWLSFCL